MNLLSYSTNTYNSSSASALPQPLLMPTKLTRAIQEALAQGYQVHPDAFRFLQTLQPAHDPLQLIAQTIQHKQQTALAEQTITKADVEAILPQTVEEAELGELTKPELTPTEIPADIKILKDPTLHIKPLEGLPGYAQLFQNRFHKLLAIAKQRPDAHQIKSIANIDRRSDVPQKITGLILAKRIKRNYVELTFDDETGRLTAMAVDGSAARHASELSLDQLAIADIEFSKRGTAIIRAAYHPDVPDHKPNLAKRNIYTAFTSDLQIGSKKFLQDAFQRFIHWLQGRAGDEYIVRRIKYLVIAGDAVDGAGVYPEQEEDLEEPDVAKQYQHLSQLLEQIPKHVSIILAPGNHDPTRQALPQPAISSRYAEPLIGMQNVTLLGNPAQIRLHGVNLLIYHGQSLYDVVATTPSLTFSKPALAMKVLLKARHLAPMYGGRTPIAPEPEDHLVIDDLPDVFHTGHVHVVDADTYKGILMLNSGTWQAQTRYQANMGINPTPALVPVVNLATLDVLIKDFSKSTKAEA